MQIELPPRVRGMGPYWQGWPRAQANPHTEALVGALATRADVAPWAGQAARRPGQVTPR
ncbi:MAG: hypothetical protein R2755_01590 [Acidimicrobiales bacterium]